MVRKIVDSRGTEYISRLASWQVWRKNTNNFAKVREWTERQTGLVSGQLLIDAFGGTCPFCAGDKEIKDSVSGDLICLCALLDYQLTVAERQDPYRSEFDGDVYLLKDMDRRDDPVLTKAISTMEAFVEEPDHWIVLIGAPGTGKSNLLQAAAMAMGPMALYISAEEFEGNVFDALSSNSVYHLVDTVRRAPILFLDDWGVEYGSPLPASQLRAVINYRYKMWRELPTVVTTNLSVNQVGKKDFRIGSRLFDTEKSRVFRIDLSDYRKKLEVKHANSK